MHPLPSHLIEQISWSMDGQGIENESFLRIEQESTAIRQRFTTDQWHIARRLIHTTADFAIVDSLHFAHDFIECARQALARRAPLYCDSSMIKSGLSMAKLRSFNSTYSAADIHCYIADEDIAQSARQLGTTRALAAVTKAQPILDGALVLIGNAPLALAAIAKNSAAGLYRPAAVIGMPVGFVNVVESKELLIATDLPYVTIAGRRGGSPLAVATLHAIMEWPLSGTP